MGLRKKVFYPQPKRELTEEELERRELAWKILEEKGVVCVNDPLRSVESDRDALKRDPYVFTGPFCDYYGDIPLSEYKRIILEGENKSY